MFEIAVIPVLQGVDGSADCFNYFFTLIFFFGGLAFNVGLLVKIINRS